IVHLADNPRFVCGLDDHEIIRTDASQGDRVRWIGIVCPVPFIAGSMNKTAVSQVLEDLGYVVTAESLVHCERKLEGGALQMAEQDLDIIGINETHLGRLAQKVFGMVDDELIERRA